MKGSITLLYLTLVSLIAPARAHADEPTCSIADALPDNIHQTWLSWMPAPDGTIQPQIEIRAMARADLAFLVTGRVNFGGDDITWEQGPYFYTSEESDFIDVEIPLG